ncbi:hypothetical protein SDC9_102363 [bioreactor metagenome]|uniref:Uncharacterized protein n=1 Tax=bioreactor metagenome TaxID=1076179 RepID=A0A645ARN1_9ZZZZ
MQSNARRLDIVHVDKDPAPLLANLHDGADVLRRRHDGCVDHGLFQRFNLRYGRHVGRVVQHDLFTGGELELIDNARSGGH